MCCLIIEQHLRPFGCIIRRLERLGKALATNTGLSSERVSESKQRWMLPGVTEVQDSLAVKILPFWDSNNNTRAGRWEDGEGRVRTKDRSRPVC